MVVEALLEKDPAARPENARAVAVMLGVPTGEDLSGLDIDAAAGVPGGYLVLPMTPLTPATPISTALPTAGARNGATHEDAPEAPVEVPTMAASAEELLD